MGCMAASSQVAAITPTPPTALRMPAIMANSVARNHWDKIFMVGIKTMETPIPTRIRPTMAILILGARPKTRLPTEAAIKNTVTALRGPIESESRPAGSCMAA